ncbi:hypothetical protein NEA10_18430 [Phormidium yuhuli AB48]|uniref:Uncharacterized protein n=1 Tax=Phormidium yuhuli AB48 TaxID=2940671 RepID=A0ABY5APJ6_9CYAN|nr:hypothetical protein [Phormidium yuhuli]USR90772.1 hypothetical protein NEA10_18430 [Phormidium yuhuli AB48]
MSLQQFPIKASVLILSLQSLALILGCTSVLTTELEEQQQNTKLTQSESHTHAHANPGHGDPEHDHHHSHDALEIPDGQPVPTIALIAHPDPMRGWNLEIQTTNFRFTPEDVNQENQPNTGHGHLYINGERGARVYGPWLHLPHLPPGSHEITVSLNANNHQGWTHNGQPIEATVVVNVPE